MIFSDGRHMVEIMMQIEENSKKIGN
jgi:hypothetical protein